MKNYFQIFVLMLLAFGITSCSKKENDVISLSFSVSSMQASVARTGDTISFNVVCNSRWIVSDSSDWCTIVKSSDTIEGNGSFSVQIPAYLSLNGRNTYIYVTSGDSTIPVKIIQTGLSKDSIAPDQTDMRDLTSIQLADEMGFGWNVGNSLDAISSETSWGNPKVTQRIIDSVKAAGFNAVRIPIAWSSHFSDASIYTINSTWMDRVEEVVNYVLNNDMYAIINIHWDGGWMQPTYAQQEYVNNRLAIMWQQIAVRFRDYDDHLLFAGTNEVMVTNNYNAPTKEYYTVQNSFNQTFVTTVRSTGGRNVYRHLVVQGFNTNIGYTYSYFTIPTDMVENKLMVEVHYYDPYNFTLNTSSSKTQWGANATDASKVETWANESYADAQFQKMKTKFINNGYAVILGEYGAIARLNLGNDSLNAEHAEYRRYYMEYITNSIVQHGLVPFYWDNGGTGNNSMGLFNRSTGAKVYPKIISAITGTSKK
jgi:endoglucanase